MKSLRIFSLAFVCMALVSTTQAQTKTETFKVAGNCGMCKATIEKAAKQAGAKTAVWDEDTKILTVAYQSSTTNTAKIQQKIAAAGYDNVGAKANQSAYDKLHGCCKYDRTMAVVDKKASCCSKGEANCKMGDATAKMDCCKDGKCTKEGHSGKACCKKAD